MTRKPQLQLNTCVTAFAEKHNGPNNLIIVYYTGHGVWREAEEYLQLTAAVTPIRGRGFQKDAHANWNRAEQILKADEIDADVLTILDTCYSSNIAKSARQSVRKFELLSACPHNETTSSPGDRSFTRVLIDKLAALADSYHDKPFSTFHLNSLICMDPRRHDTPSQLWFRLPNEQNILLAPLHSTTTSPSTSTSTSTSTPQTSTQRRVQLEPRGYLTLRLALNNARLSREQIEYLAEKLSKAFGNKHLIGLRKIDWLAIKPVTISPFERVALAAYYGKQWKRAVLRGRSGRVGGVDGRGRVDGVDGGGRVDGAVLGAVSNAPRKRARDTPANVQFPPPKRRVTDASTPPLTPTANPVREGAE